MMEKQRLISPAMKDQVLKYLCEHCAVGVLDEVVLTDEMSRNLDVRRNEFYAILDSFGEAGLADIFPAGIGSEARMVQLKESAHKLLNEGGYS